jgi:NTP pyrophosphatase (non-canonical NTP hydrolase)
MTFEDAATGARRTRELYRRLEQQRYGREWDVRDLFIGFQGEVGDLGQLLGAHQGVRPGPEDLRAALGHEIADCMWSLFVIADELGVDVESSFAALVDELTVRITSKLAE